VYRDVYGGGGRTGHTERHTLHRGGLEYHPVVWAGVDRNIQSILGVLQTAEVVLSKQQLYENEGGRTRKIYS